MQSGTTPQESTASLPRGHACLPCRRRKLRCDGSRPICGQCTTRNEPDDCEYVLDIQGLTRSQLLEETIAVLETRIRNIEHPDDTVTLKRLERDVTPRARSPPSTTANLLRATTDIAHCSASTLHSAVNCITPYALQIGLFLRPSRLLALARTARARDAITESLLMVTVLWSRHLSAPNSNDPHRDLHLSEILAKIQQCPALVGSEPTIQHKLNFVQAEILLATYFFAMGCVTDGQYHTSAAVSLTFGQQATQEDSLRGQRMPYPFGDVILPSTHPSHSTNTLLCGARTWEDRMEEECTNASYTVYIMDRTWTTLSGVPSTAAAPPIGNLDSTSCPPRSGHQSATAQQLSKRAEATTLLSRATDFASRWRDPTFDTSQRDRAVLQEFHVLDDTLARLEASALGPSVTALDNHEVVVTRILVSAATIQLHSRLARSRPRSRERCLTAARIIAAAAQNLKAGAVVAVDPIVAMLFFLAAGYLVGHCDYRLPTTPSVPAFGPSIPLVETQSAIESLNCIVEAMRSLSCMCPLMGIKANEVQEMQNSRRDPMAMVWG